MASAAARKKTSAGMSDKTSDIILVAICAIALIIVAYPLYYVLVASVSDPYDVYAGKTFCCPAGSRWTATRRYSPIRRSSPASSTP